MQGTNRARLESIQALSSRTYTRNPKAEKCVWPCSVLGWGRTQIAWHNDELSGTVSYPAWLLSYWLIPLT